MNQNPNFQLLFDAIEALRNAQGVIVTDSTDRENEADLIFPAQTLSVEQMALLIRECSGIVCLCLSAKKIAELDLPMMTTDNYSRFQTAFTVSIEAKDGVTTGVSAQDRLTTVRAAIAEDGASRIVSPGHVFPLRARDGGVLERPGHTEATVDLMRMAGLEPCGVLCELTNPDGTMMNRDEAKAFSDKHHYPLISIEELIAYRQTTETAVSLSRDFNRVKEFGSQTIQPL
ncbi:3,4-dihydroxy-2-butanone-4-phosphate synthase [uncultured Sulfuricurvum sp.]|uniref:3,4-dihydroxy-2-butanone-4-phosphate synthase n=1 Tax=uncultured Sulfuricurvum sp. TaxID=430693 RepID=UPI00262EF9A8|nr:3,4-dihydroxy-2-butanone-4-phosphate synthase [uncultured Sulfuricurvum sp.]